MTAEAVVHLGTGHVRPLWAGHPWVFAQAIASIDGDPAAGDPVAVQDPRGNHLGRGFWSPGSAIPVRLVTRAADERLDADALRRRITGAATWRHALLDLPDSDTNGYRVVHAEGDSLPGLVVDRFGSAAVVQLTTPGMKRREDIIFAAVTALPGIETVVEVPGGHDARADGVIGETRVVDGPAIDVLELTERGLVFRVPLELAQKTGFYFDQRANRARVEALARGRRVLDAFCYVGGFAIAAARGGASSVVAVDRSTPALEAARLAAEANDVAERIELRRLDLRRDLRSLDAPFDLVIIDPPKLIPARRHRQRGLVAYEATNREAIRLVAPGGLLLTCSCSAALGGEELLRVIARAAAMAGRSVRVLERGGQGPDHPTPAAFPEGRYLESALLLVD